MDFIILCLGVKYFPKIDHSNFIMKVNGRKFFHLNLEFKKSDYQTFERQQIYSLVNKYCLSGMCQASGSVRNIQR